MSLRTRHKLNPRQEAFILKVYADVPATRAYWETYRKGRLPKVDSRPYNVAKANASRLLAKGNVSNALEELRKKDEKAAQFSRDEKREILCCLGRGEGDTSPGDQIRAIEADNRMTGDNAPEKQIIETEGEVSLLAVVKRNQKKPDRKK